VSVPKIFPLLDEEIKVIFKTYEYFSKPLHHLFSFNEIDTVSICEGVA
jgi:hypothetical protein